MFTFCPSCGQKDTVQKLNDTHYKCSACGWQHWNNPKAAVAIAFVKDGQLLFSRRAVDPQKGRYDLPGGFVDFGETPYDAALREIGEETSVRVQREDLHFLELYTNHYDKDIFSVDILFVVEKWEGEFVPTDDSAELIWKPFNFIHDPSFWQPYTGLDKLLADKFGQR